MQYFFGSKAYYRTVVPPTRSLLSRGQSPQQQHLALAPKRNPAAQTVTMKIGYDGKADIAKGVCGYDGCKSKITKTPVHPEPIRCPAHTKTHETSYGYLSKSACQKNTIRSWSSARLWTPRTESSTMMMTKCARRGRFTRGANTCKKLVETMARGTCRSRWNGHPSSCTFAIIPDKPAGKQIC